MLDKLIVNLPILEGMDRKSNLEYLAMEDWPRISCSS